MLDDIEGRTRPRTFGGTLVRSITHSGSEYREFFQWFDVDRLEATSFPILGEEIVDEFTIVGQPKLGPAIVYVRELADKSASACELYFSGNMAVVMDTEHRARSHARADKSWPTDEEYIAGFREIYGSTYFETSRAGADSVWDRAAEMYYKWITARAIVSRARESGEILCLVSDSPRVGDEEIVRKVSARLLAEGWQILDGLIELFDTHVMRPESGSILFEIRRSSSFPSL